MRRLFTISLLVLISGCVIPPQTARNTRSSEPATAEQSSTLSPWLNPEAVITSATRLVTPHGMDIRQALYVTASDEPEPTVLLRFRDYSERRDGQPDAQHIALLKAQSRETQQFILDGEITPLEIIVSPKRGAWALSALDLADGVQPSHAPLVVLAREALGDELRIESDDQLLPLGFIDEYTLFAREVKAVQIDGGLPAISLDWQGQCWRLRLGDKAWANTDINVFVPQHGGITAAGYTIECDPVLPGQAMIHYTVGSHIVGNSSILAFSSPYHVSYTAFPWQPPLVWVDGSTVATVQFLPDATGKSSQANYQGLFRLVCVSLEGVTTLVADHLSPGLPVVAGNGVLFYTRQEPGDAGASWELWAASADGLRKQRLWQAEGECLYLSVEDVLDGQRLLAQRQYIEVKASTPELHSELREFSLVPLSSPEAVLDFAPLESPRQATTDSDGLMVPPVTGGGTGSGPPPIAIPE